MYRLLSLLLVCLTWPAMGWADSADMERLAARVADEIRTHLLAVETKVAYVGMDGARAYLRGDLSAIRPGQSVAFYRDGAAMLSADGMPEIFGRESAEVGKGQVTAIHDKTAWVQIDMPAKVAIARGDWAMVHLGAPTLKVIPFFVEDGMGAPKTDGRARILRSLILYNLKRSGLTVVDVPLLPSEVDATGLPAPAALSQFDTDGVLLIGRLVPKPGAPATIVVGIALYDLGLKDMRLARSYEAQTLDGFSPLSTMLMERPPIEKPAARRAADKAVPATPKETKPYVDPLTGICRLYASTSLRLDWPPKTPAEWMIAELTSATLPEVAIEWIEEAPGTVRIHLPLTASASGTTPTATELVELLTARSQEPAGVALIGRSRWNVLSDNELSVKLDSPLPDMRERLADPQFRLLSAQFEPVGAGWSPYRLASRGVRTVILGKNPAYALSGVWAQAPDTLMLKVERDPKKRAKGFEEGDVDLHELSDEEYVKYGPSAEARVIQSPAEELMAMAFNLRRSPGDKIHFRRLLAMAIDRRTVLEVSLNQRGTTAESMLPPEAKDVAPVLVKLPERNPVTAQVLVKEIIDTTTRLALVFPSEEAQYGLVADSIRSDLAALNVTVELQGLSWRAYADRLSTGDYDLALVSLSPAPPFRLWLQRHFSSTGVSNLWGYTNPIVDPLLSESGDLGAAQDLIQSDLPVLPLFWLSRRIVLGPRVAEARPSLSPVKFFSSVKLR